MRNRLSLSSKLFIREAGNTALRAAQGVAGLPGWFWKRLTAKNYLPDPPPPPVFDFNTPVRQLSQSLPEQDHPLVNIQTSIIMPVFNKAGFTFQCLRSLLDELDFSEAEIIVVDNASTDTTAEVLDYFRDYIKVIRNDENRGFVDASNQGAAIARGKYLLFLNNDIKVEPGWLKYLIQTIESDAAVGAVGSMFLNPDGSVQEAGAIVWSNGDAHHYGWGYAPDDRRFNFAREVDYCSAASLLIRADLFRQIGGFDQRYAPAYYEDVDLCFSVRSLGFQVIYQPRSRVVHYEGATAGRDVSKGFKRFQIVNREKLVQKWREILGREHFEKDLKRLFEAAHRHRPDSVIVFDERLPTPDRDAGSGRMVWMLRSLAKGSHVVFVPFYGARGGPYEQSLWQHGIETADPFDYRRLLKRKGVRAAVVSRPNIAEAMIPRIKRANVPAVFDMVDAHFIRLAREAQISGDQEKSKAAEEYRQLETRLARASDLIWCNSSYDKQIMETEAPGKRIEVVPTIHELQGSGKPFAERRDLLFLGNLIHRPNHDAVLFLMQEIYPLLKKALPEIKIYIVGDNVPDDIQAFESEDVRVTGYLPDIEPLFQSARVFLAPIRFGAGVKGKVGDAMSHGLPTVTTSIGAEGFGLEHGVDVMIADDPVTFSQAVVQLYTDEAKWQTISQNSRIRVQESFTPEVIANTINNSIREISQGRHDS